MRVLIITSEWSTHEHPAYDPFVVQQVEYLRRAGVEVEIFAFRGEKNPINYLRAWLKLRSLHDIERFNLIHAHFGQNGLLALRARLPLVVTFHGSELHGIVGSNGRYTMRGAILRLLSRYVARQATEIIMVSEHLTNYLPSRLPFQVIPCGVDFELFRPMPQLEARKQLGLPSGKLLVLFAAYSCRPVKRRYLAQEAVTLLKKEFDVDLVEIFDVPHKVVPLYMNACDALVITSKHKGSPTAVKEALACNLPIVSVKIGDVPQRIQEVDGCVVCDDDAPTTIAQGLAQVLRSRQRICGRNFIANLDERLNVQAIIKVYQTALAKGWNRR